uniref:Uncharacterized protein n=1 Tax=Micrurus corallinus TaxID=54390 RepID=A0A2D4FXZ5_MICCO
MPIPLAHKSSCLNFYNRDGQLPSSSTGSHASWTDENCLIISERTLGLIPIVEVKKMILNIHVIYFGLFERGATPKHSPGKNNKYLICRRIKLRFTLIHMTKTRTHFYLLLPSFSLFG